MTASATVGRQQENLVLCNDRLRVEISAPGAGYRGPRFDWTAFVSQVTLDGACRFCVPETIGPGPTTGGLGLCNEFRTPLGFESAKPGEPFGKVGIGLLTRPDEAKYDFFRRYPIDPFDIAIEQGDERQIKFIVQPRDCRGYAARLEKVLKIDGTRLAMEYRLENVGRQPIHTREYAHNFIAINGQPLDDRHIFETSLMADTPIDCGALYQKYPHGDCMMKIFSDPPPTSRYFWKLTHTPSGHAMSETGEFPCSYFVLWGRAHVLCAEVFIDINVAPGQSQSWRREYCFE